ncbi:MAG: polysaccharide deacetylase family protein [Actinobacteria bacterium]|nr:polysaccharide deacetylase family protein [Actinomycetota bacterium]
MNRSESYALFRVSLCAVMAVVACVALLVVVQVAHAAPATVVYSGSRDQPRIALTFDDNFNATRAQAVLEALRRTQTPATMFVTGSYVAGIPELTASLARGDFEIADHSMSHPDLTRLSWSGLLYEIGGGTRTFTALTGVRTAPLIRPPYGATNALVAEAAGHNGFLYVVNWDIDTRDWTGRSADGIVRHVLDNAHNGAIVLMHLSAAHTYEAVPRIVEGLRSQGYELVTVSRLLKGDRRFLDTVSGGAVGTAIGRLVDAGIMSGYNEDYFGPEDGITRAQTAKVMVQLAGLHTEEVERVADRTFMDVPPQRGADGSWLSFPFDYVEEAAAAGLVQGRFDDQGRRIFEPYVQMTRLQMARILARMAREVKGYGDEAADFGPTFGDVPRDARADVGVAAGFGLMTGYTDGTFRPYELATRAQVAVVACRFIDLPRFSDMGIMD